MISINCGNKSNEPKTLLSFRWSLWHHSASEPRCLQRYQFSCLRQKIWIWWPSVQIYGGSNYKEHLSDGHCLNTGNTIQFNSVMVYCLGWIFELVSKRSRNLFVIKQHLWVQRSAAVKECLVIISQYSIWNYSAIWFLSFDQMYKYSSANVQRPNLMCCSFNSYITYFQGCFTGLEQEESWWRVRLLTGDT